MRQIKFGFIQDYKKTFGGETLKGKRKSKRPLSLKSPMHLILKSDLKSVFKPSNQSLQTLIQNMCGKFNIHLYDIAINWNHIHFLIQIRERKDYVRFIRALTSKLEMAIRKHNPGLKEKLFTLRPFTRIVSWGRDFENVRGYIVKNFFEANNWTKRAKTEKTKRSDQNLKKKRPKSKKTPNLKTSIDTSLYQGLSG